VVLLQSLDQTSQPLPVKVVAVVLMMATQRVAYQVDLVVEELLM
jgi:hypothetical protein